MRLMRYIRVGGQRYKLFHCNDSDSRHFFDEDDDIVLIVDANLAVHARDGRFGNIESEGTWKLYYGPNRARHDTGISVGNYCSVSLLQAEIEVFKFYIQNTKLPKFKRAAETECGYCD